VGLIAHWVRINLLGHIEKGKIWKPNPNQSTKLKIAAFSWQLQHRFRLMPNYFNDFLFLGCLQLMAAFDIC